MSKPQLSLTEFVEKYLKIKVPNGQLISMALTAKDKAFFKAIEDAEKDGCNLSLMKFRMGPRIVKIISK